MHPDSDEDALRKVHDALRLMIELEAFYEIAQFLGGVEPEAPNAVSIHPGTDHLIAESNSMEITDADMDVSDATLVLSRFRLLK